MYYTVYRALINFSKNMELVCKVLQIQCFCQKMNEDFLEEWLSVLNVNRINTSKFYFNLIFILINVTYFNSY